MQLDTDWFDVVAGLVMTAGLIGGLLYVASIYGSMIAS
jgi:hypothetical protein